jgi:hypothetical protein
MPAELPLFQFLMAAAFPAYNAVMRRGWLILLMVVLAANGFASCALVCRSCHNDNRHSCCSQTAKMQADCCARSRGSIAMAPEPQGAFAAPAAAFMRAEVELSIREGQVSALDLTQYPSDLQPHPIVLRI